MYHLVQMVRMFVQPCGPVLPMLSLQNLRHKERLAYVLQELS